PQAPPQTSPAKGHTPAGLVFCSGLSAHRQTAAEFTCGSCCLVRHRPELAREKNGLNFCLDCAG
ncbi:DUF4193 family protein, partial [Arthrobacter rhombi]